MKRQFLSILVTLSALPASAMDFDTEGESLPLDEKHVRKIEAEIRKAHTLREGGKVGQQLKAF
jgi:hypothetical protein